MKHILAAAIGSTGDLNPILGIGAALRRRGHEVALIASPVFAEHARAAGLAFEPVGTAADYHRGLIANPRIWRWRTAVAVAFRDGWLRYLEPVYERIRKLHRPGGTVLLANLPAIGARVAQEKLGLPLASLYASPAILRSLDDPPLLSPVQLLPRWIGRTGKRLAYRFMDLWIDHHLARGLNSFRAGLGLPPVRRVWNRWTHSPDRVLGLWPDWYAAADPAWPPQLALTGFLNCDRAGAEPLGGGASGRGPDDPPIVFTCGSALTHAPAFFKSAAGAARTLGRPVHFVTEDPFAPGEEVPAGITLSSYVPYSRLLPRAAAIVHHGGIGTAAAALAAGIPQVVVPVAFDQFDNASRLVKLGVARWIPRRRLGPRPVAAALESLLGSAEVAERCRSLRSLLEPERALRRACELVEEL